jgi:hypothetical protein
MGTIKKGILGGFLCKVGTVVGGSWKGISYMRSLPQSIKNPHTDGQMSQHTKFVLALSLLKLMTAFLRTGWKLRTQTNADERGNVLHFGKRYFGRILRL